MDRGTPTQDGKTTWFRQFHMRPIRDEGRVNKGPPNNWQVLNNYRVKGLFNGVISKVLGAHVRVF